MARVVANSFSEHHPDVPFFVLLADEVDGYFDPAQEPYELLLLHDLDVPDAARFRFGLPEQPLTYAATPYLIAKLIELGYDRVLFIKQESLVLGELGTISSALPPGGVALTPHLLAPLEGSDAEDRELMILLAGVFNAGFVAVAAGETSKRLLSWWKDRVYRQCRYAVAEGIHYEQRWLDLAPAYFEEVRVLHDPGMNVGHWNLPDRRVTVANASVRVEGEPCRLFRFSGYDVDRPEAATRYSPRLRTSELGDAGIVFERYRSALLDAGWAEARTWPYAYDRFDNGVPIPDIARDIYRRIDDVARFGDPFDAKGSASFFAWLKEPIDDAHGPSRFWFGVYEGRPDLHVAFPDILGRHRAAFLRWTRSLGVVEHGVPEALRVTPAICTVVAKNYLPFARVLARSLHRHHPECRLVVALADEIDGWFDPATEPFSMLTPAELRVPDLRDLAFRTTQREFAITLKPYLLARMLDESESALFLDPDVLVLGGLDSLLDRVQHHALTLVPHALEPPVTPDSLDRELVLHRAGVFNGGVVGVRRDHSTVRFLSWWQKRVHRLCIYAAERGVHYDQRWLDLALGFVEDTHVHRDAGVNVAHWNLPERPVRIRDGRITAGDAQCVLFHFSGFDPDFPDMPTQYRPALRFEEFGDAPQLFRDYADELRHVGWNEARDAPYTYGSFDNGVPIPHAARQLYSQLHDRSTLGDPFATTGEHSYFGWLNESPSRFGGPSRLWLFVHSTRPDLQRAFPRPRGLHRRRFLAWTRTHGAGEHNVAPELL